MSRLVLTLVVAACALVVAVRKSVDLGESQQADLQEPAFKDVKHHKDSLPSEAEVLEAQGQCMGDPDCMRETRIYLICSQCLNPPKIHECVPETWFDNDANTVGAFGCLHDACQASCSMDYLNKNFGMDYLNMMGQGTDMCGKCQASCAHENAANLFSGEVADIEAKLTAWRSCAHDCFDTNKCEEIALQNIRVNFGNTVAMAIRPSGIPSKIIKFEYYHATYGWVDTCSTQKNMSNTNMKSCSVCLATGESKCTGKSECHVCRMKKN